MKVKYVLYTMLCMMFIGCKGCTRWEYIHCWGCDPEEVDWYLGYDDYPFALTYEWGGFEYGLEPTRWLGNTNWSTMSVPMLQSDIGFGAKYFIGSGNALRVDFNLFNYTNGKDSNAAKKTAIAPFVGFEHHFRNQTSISPYAGIGLGYSSWSLSNQNIEEGSAGRKTGVPMPQATSDVTDSYTTLLVQAMAGFDWYPTKGIAIGAEYALGFVSMGQSHTDATGKKTDSPTATAFGILPVGNIHVLFHL